MPLTHFADRIYGEGQRWRHHSNQQKQPLYVRLCNKATSDIWRLGAGYPSFLTAFP